MKAHLKNGRVWEFKWNNELNALTYETTKNTYAALVFVNNISEEINIFLGRQGKEQTELKFTGWQDKTEMLDFIEMANGSIHFFKKMKL